MSESFKLRKAGTTTPPTTFRRGLCGLLAITMGLGIGLVVGFQLKPSSPAAAAGPCDQPVQNAIACENSLPGSPQSEWDVQGAGDPTIQGFGTDISVNKGDAINFKINTDASAYTIDIYRLGYYGGAGARKVATITPTAALPQGQPDCLSDPTTGLVDCGNWAVSASWSVPSDAVSGIYIARPRRTDTGGASHMIFVVRDDASHSKLFFQTSDLAWQAYNNYGGNSLYVGAPAGRAYKVSYNRPFTTRESNSPMDWLFNSEYPMLRWIERNGYDVSYTTGVDSARSGDLIKNHKVFMSVGHDEYWSGAQRANVEAARDAGVNLAFFSGNEVFWKTRWEPSIDGSNTDYRTVVCYKETHNNAPLDPADPPTWTGSWRDKRFSPPADGGRPENALTGTLYKVNADHSDSITVPAANGKLRFWRNTNIANLQPGETWTLPAGTLGYEWDVETDNGSRPAGLVDLSTTTLDITNDLLLDNGSTYGSGVARHALTLYRAPSGALVFGAGTVQWSWGLDAVHDRPGTPTDVRMQQATVNLFADMGAQPSTPQPEVTLATMSTDTTAPVSTITSPANGSSTQVGPNTVTGTATDSGGGVVGAVEVSTDGGATWHPASGGANWNYSFNQPAAGTLSIKSRASDDSANLETPGAGISLTVTPRECPCSIWNASVVPQNPAATDDSSVEVGVKFQSDIDGAISGVRFYKGAGNTGAHVGSLWTATGTLLASATFAGETASGWQEVTFDNPVPISANTTYVAAYFAPTGHYAADARSFSSGPVDNPPLHALANSTTPNGVYGYSASSSFPTNSFLSANYFVDPVFTAQSVDTTPPAVAVKSPAPGATGVSVLDSPKATYTEPVQPATVSFVLKKPGNITVPASVSYDAATRTSRLAPQSSLATSTTYTATISGATDLAGNVLAPPVTWSFTTSATAPPPLISLWDSSATPVNPSVDDSNAVELGVKFQSDISGAVTGVRFYKGVANTGTHTGSLWTADGTLLSTVVFTNETASGWQEMSFPTPVTIAADTTYVVSYYAPSGHYAADGSYFAASGVDNAPLHGLADSGSPNGVFHYSASGFPSNSFNASNYWVDVVFATGAGDNTPPTVASTLPAANAVAVATGSTVAATFSEAVQPATVIFTLTGPGGSSVPGTISYDSANDRSILTPTAPLNGGSTFTAHVSGAKDTAGNQLAGTTTWSFTTADTTAPTVSSTVPAAGATNIAVNATVAANYSEAVQPATVAFSLTDPSSNIVPATVTYDVANQRSVLTPTAPLTGATVYTATVSGAQDAAGNAMTTPTTWSFTTVDNVPPVISSINAVPGSTTATITWTTNEAATTRVNYGTSPSSLTLQVTNATPVTLHAINLTGLGAHTTYYYRVVSVDAATNSATAPASPAAPATFVTSFATVIDTTSANFSAGNTGPNTYVSQTADGEVILAPAVGAEFGGTALPTNWGTSVLASGGAVTVNGGSLVVDGAWARTTGTFAPGRSLEFIATFTSTANQSVGMGNTLNESPWAMFSTRAGGALRASTRNGTTPIDISLGTAYLDAPHTYRIDWTSASVVYRVDGVVVATQNTGIPTSMRAVVRDNTPGGNAVVVNWLRLGPYAATGTFTSRVLDGGASVLWDSATWTAGLPSGTSAVVKVRTGNSATPNTSWTAYATVGSGQSINVRSRYIQYQVVLSTSPTSQTPTFQDITVRYGA